MIVYTDPQGTEAWLEARRGVITGSRAKDARDRLADKTDKKTGEVTRGGPSSKQTLYAQDVARERCGGMAEAVYVNAAMRTGTEQEPLARMAYEARTGEMVEEAGFITTDDAKFGCSVDGFVGDDGLVEIKTLVSSKTLFTAMVDSDVADYIDQINFALWLLGRRWCDLILWAPDLPAGQLTIIRIERNDDAIEALEADLVAFEKLVSGYEAKLRRAMGKMLTADRVELRPDPDAALKSNLLARSPAIAAGLPASIFG